MRRTVLLGFVVWVLTLACSDDSGEPVTQPDSVALTVEISSVRHDSRAWGITWEGWRDGESASAVLTEDDDPIWFEREGVVVRSGVSVPDLTTPWVEFDLMSWGALDYTHRDFAELGAAVEFWGAPSVRSLLAVRDLVAEQRLDDGPSTATVAGVDFLAAIDEMTARRSLVDCASDAEVQATVDNGIVTEIQFELHTGAFLRQVRVTFTPWEGALPAPPTADEITPSRHRRGETPPPVREPIGCDHGPQTPVEIDRGGCEAAPDERSEAAMTALTRHAESTPSVRSRFWLHVAPEVGFDELQRRLSGSGLAVAGVNAQGETEAFGMLRIHHAEIDDLPATQVELDGFVAAEANQSFTAGTTSITAIEVDGTWGDIARFTSDCVFTPMSA